MDFPINSMVIFNSYVKLPEGMLNVHGDFQYPEDRFIPEISTKFIVKHQTSLSHHYPEYLVISSMPCWKILHVVPCFSQQSSIHFGHGFQPYPLVNIQKASKSYGKSPFFMVKSTISTGPWLQVRYVNVYQAGYHPSSSPPKKMTHSDHSPTKFPSHPWISAANPATDHGTG